MRAVFGWLTAAAIIAAAVAVWLVSTPSVPEAYVALSGDAARGKTVFAAAGCASCHVAPDAEPADRPVLSGGQVFVTDFGRIAVPNISPHPEAGIGGWTDAEIIHAIAAGVSPDGKHYYPAFPYASYGLADPSDLADLVAYMRTLPASPVASPDSALRFPFSIRATVGVWKALFVPDGWVLEEAATDEIARGRYLVESLGHCGECHTPRNALGALDRGQWLAGAPSPDGKGKVPNITPGSLTWSEAEIAQYLETGFTPEFDVAGGAMTEVIENTGQLSDADRQAIAAYLKAVPALEADPS